LAYAQTTLDDLTNTIAQLMGDPSFVYWKQDEIYRSVSEALLFWGAMSSYWRDLGNFTTSTGVGFYDVSAQLPTLRTRNYTLGQLTTEIQYHLLENPAGISGTNATIQFSISEITAALTRNRNKLLLDSQVPFTYANGLNTPPTPDGQCALDQTVALIERAAWLDGTSGKSYMLHRIDPWEADGLFPAWQTNPGNPVAYSTIETVPLGFQFVPPPASAGTLNLLYCATNTMAVADGTSFAYPDEYVHAIKYFSLYEALSTYDPGFDANRARYCLERYKQIVELSQQQHSVVRVLISGVQIPLDRLYNLDTLRPGWEDTSGQPDAAACAFDELALANVPNGAYSVTVDVIRSAPLPTLGTDFIQVGKEELPYIIDYCRHVLSFKQGGQEFIATMPLYDNFVRGATQRNRFLKIKARYLTPLFSQPAIEKEVSPAA
jgi:hypothetical protein